MSEPQFRRANPAELSDARAILEVHRKSVHGTGASFYTQEILDEWGPLPITEEMIDRFTHEKNSGEVISVAEVEGLIVGFTEVVPGNEELRAVYVDPICGRRGIGNRLLQISEGIARENGCKRLWLHSSLNAKIFYETLGYIPVKEGEHILQSGRKMPCWFMEKML